MGRTTGVVSLLIVAVIWCVVLNLRFGPLVLFWIYIVVMITQLSQYGGNTTAISRWAIMVVCILSLAAFSQRNSARWLHGVVPGLLVLSVYSLMTSFGSYHPQISQLKAVSIALLAVLLVFLHAFAGQNRPHSVNVILRGYEFIAVVLVISNVIFGFVFREESYLGGGFRGWFGNPNTIGALYGIFVVPLILNFCIRESSSRLRFMMFLVLGIAVVQLIMSGSRAGFLAGLVAVTILVWSRSLFFRFVTVMLLLITVSGILLPSVAANPLISFMLKGEETLSGSGRFDIWLTVYRGFLAQPWFGTGLGVSEMASQITGFRVSSHGLVIEKANSYLAILEELGIVGALLFVLLILVPVLSKIFQTVKHPQDEFFELNLLFVSVIFAGAMNAVFEAWLFSIGSFISVSFWLFLDLFLLLGGQSSQSVMNQKWIASVSVNRTALLSRGDCT